MIEEIKSPEKLKELSGNDIGILCQEIREEIITQVKKNGGHLASNLGMVESTIAIHRVFNMPEDALVFDVGHQCYTHKLLTGRYNNFSSVRTFGGISGFTSREESEYDVFTAGHSGSALSAAIGIAKANKISKKDNWVICVIGDGSFTNGMVYEALNNCSEEKLQMIIILNDNEMSISENVGGISNHFTRLRNSRRYFVFKHVVQRAFNKIPLIGHPLVMLAYNIKEFFKKLVLNRNVFESMDLFYMGPVDGNDEKKMEQLLREAKTKDKISVIHMITVKGKGYPEAEKHPDKYHFAGGEKSSEATFSSEFGKWIVEKAKEKDDVVAITAAMDKGTGLSEFKANYPDRFIDVGIAEECAVTLAGGIAIGGKYPVLPLYSTFMQRAYDQLLEDVALQKTNMLLTIDRAGLVPGDGVTHQGVWDASLLSSIPNITIYSPDTFEELKTFLNVSVNKSGLNVVRYPKGTENKYDEEEFRYKGDIAVSGEGDIVIMTYGRITKNAVEYMKQTKRNIKIIKLLKIFPLNYDLIKSELSDVKFVYFLEEGIRNGGIGEKVSSELSHCGIQVYVNAVDDFLTHGSVEELEALCGFDVNSINNDIETLCNIKEG